MILVYQIPQISCFVDAFMEEFNKTIENSTLENRLKKVALISLSEVLTIQVLFQFSSVRCLKHFYEKYIQVQLTIEFPNTVSYDRLVKIQKQVILPMSVFQKHVTWVNVPRNL